MGQGLPLHQLKENPVLALAFFKPGLQNLPPFEPQTLTLVMIQPS